MAIVRYQRKLLTAEQIARLEKLKDIPDEAIDFSDIPDNNDGYGPIPVIVVRDIGEVDRLVRNVLQLFEPGNLLSGQQFPLVSNDRHNPVSPSSTRPASKKERQDYGDRSIPEE